MKNNVFFILVLLCFLPFTNVAIAFDGDYLADNSFEKIIDDSFQKYTFGTTFTQSEIKLIEKSVETMGLGHTPAERSKIALYFLSFLMSCVTLFIGNIAYNIYTHKNSNVYSYYG